MFPGQVPRRGSSPHVRGAPQTEDTVPGRDGIIPACAGSTRSAYCNAFAFRDHPRMCGEHPDSERWRVHYRGSSPHVRGALGGSDVGVIIGGIIPACAGSTFTTIDNGGILRDHPRMCGEHKVMVSVASIEEGSSPHVRGAPRRSRPARAVVGIIPACAGSTSSAAFSSAAFRDHPRMCGEHSSASSGVVTR